MKQKSSKWLQDIISLNKDNLVSIINYDGNKIAVILKEINLNNLLLNSKITVKLQKKNIIPIYLTGEHITTSCDVYPIEYLEMGKDYEVLYGDDILENLDIPFENLRLECEQKIKGALIRLTQVILETGENMKLLSKTAFLAMKEILSGVTGMLLINGYSGQINETSVFKEAEEQFKIDLKPFFEIIEWKNGTAPENKKKLLFDFYEKIEDLASLVDKMEESGK
jgi:hypothetical protein